MRHPGFVWLAGVLAGLLIGGCGCSDGFAQGSTGGTVGKEDKSVSGTRSSEPERPARGSKPGSGERRAPARGGGGSVTVYDGGWTFVAAGCAAGAKHGAVSGGRISIGDGGGQVGAGGAMRLSFTTIIGVKMVAIGRLSGTTGSGTYSRADGCAGRWTATKQ